MRLATTGQTPACASQDGGAVGHRAGPGPRRAASSSRASRADARPARTGGA